MPAAPSIEIKSAGPPIKISGNTAVRSNVPAPAAPAPAPKPEPAPAAPSAPAEPKSPFKAPFESKSKKEFFGRLKEKSGIKPAEAAPEKTAAPEAKEVDQPMPGEHLEAPDEATPPEEGAEAKPVEATPAAKPDAAKPAGEKTKVNPWKLAKEWEGKAGELEKQLLETKRLIPDESGRKIELERLTKAEKRAQELEEEIRYVNYAKSKEFAEKFDLPYQESFKTAMSELGQLMVNSPDGATRPAEPGDLLDLVNAPLGKAKEIAMERFGDFADEAMAHRKDVRRLWDERVKALDSARKVAAEREQQLAEQHKTMSQEITKFVTENWEKANEAIKVDPEHAEFFKLVEGDEERNSILKKGYEFVDSALQGNPMDPRLKPEDRSTIIKKHAALRNRAAAYGTLRHLLKLEREAHQAALEKLKQYEASTPTTEGGAKPVENGAPVKASAQVYAKLRGLARR